MKIAISNGRLSCELSSLGAELTSVRFDGRERLWQNENGAWGGHAPVLFPVCGNCAVRLNGKEYTLPRHGFARTSEFTLVKRRRSSVCFELKSSDTTRAVYPFEFVLRVKYSLHGARLRICYEVKNPADETLYFSCGGHESFALSRPLGEYELRFEEYEKFDSLLCDEEGRLTGGEMDFGEGERFILPEKYLADDRSVIFRNLNSRKVALCERGGRTVALVTFEGFSNLLLWRAEKSGFICIEPWHNLPDGFAAEEISARSGIIALPPHDKTRLVRTVTYF